MSTRTREPRPAPATPSECDNHPGVPAVTATTSDGKHSVIAFCERCIPKHWRK